MGTKLTEMRDGCFHRAMDDEPMFVLLGRDAQAPARVRDWAAQRKSDIALGRKPASDMAMVDDAYATADKMDAWREANDGAWRTDCSAVPTLHDLTVELEEVMGRLAEIDAALRKLPQARRVLRPHIATTLLVARCADAKLWRARTRARFDAMDKAGAFVDSRRPDPNYWRDNANPNEQ